ncbi:tetratricopeptide repeat protein [Thiobacillus denitrificans]|uniref:protein O-GlcNAc transferase n=1 Tax=Thiobacillus denitrificans TaxID=36861 RepID=A0A119CTT0_THIDE|nr:tetratricopeptide repeat protein [Thiobacillus denitrificans]KVW92209.1 hypothetical protein ABW22_15970 [Thiobacillus denitrificans]
MTVSASPQQPADPIMAQALKDLEQSLAQALQLAVNHHQCGQIEEAETLYRGILQAQPSHPDANHHLGVLAVQMKQAGAALPYFAAALEAKPEQQQYWLSYIDALIQADETETAQQLLALGRQHGLQGDDMEALAGRLNEGPSSAKQSVASEPEAPQSDKKQTRLKASPSAKSTGKAQPRPQQIDKLGAFYKQRRFIEAEALARALTARFPRHGFCWKVLGAAIMAQGQHEQALLPMQTAAQLWPEDAETHGNLGIVLKAIGRLAEAEASYRRALEIAPAYAEAHNNLGVMCKGQGRLIEAEVHYRRALEIKLDFIEAHSNLGNALKDLGRLAQAEASYRRALEIAPAYVEGHNNLGVLLQEQGRLMEAEASYRQALEINPAYGDGYNNLGNALQVQGRLMEAEASFRRALQISPDDAVSHSSLLFCLSHSEAVGAVPLFVEHCRFGERFEAPLRALWREHGNPRDPERRLQVGFVSGDFRSHAMAFFIEPVLEQLAGHASLSLHAYSNHATQDDVSQRLRGHVRHWHTIAGLSDAALAEKIRADGIDILIDLSGHTDKHRLLSFARKPAPIQVSWMGYPGTTGLSSMDYYLSDRFLLPPGQFDSQFTEKLVYLPANAPFLPMADAPPVNDLPALGRGYVTFGSFNRQNKLSRAVIALWSQLLRAVPTSRMVLGAMPQDGQYDTLTAWFAGEGIERERLDFHPRSNMQDYLALHHQVDVCLDTFPYNGGTTTLHALWMGVPTLTLAGSTVAGRTGAGILGHVGLGALVAQDAAAFVQQGLSLAADNFSTLARLRAGLRERFSQSAPSQPELIATGLERALRTMWQRWCAGLPTESFEVNHASMQNMQNMQNAVQEAGA